MKVSEIEEKLKKLSETWSNSTFIFEMLLAYGLPKATITRVMKGHSNLSKAPGVVSIKNRVLFRAVEGEDLHVTISNMAKEAVHGQRFVIATDFKTLLAQDMSGKATPLETPFNELHRHYAYFLPWAGLEKTAVVNENPADRKAAEKLARLYDELKEANNIDNDEQRHALNVFLIRLLFCFFAEDTGILEDGQFSVALGSHTADNGSDSSEYLRRLFRIMGTPEDKREALPRHLETFPFVGKSLFGDDLPVPEITRKGRSTILVAGDLDWAAINPDIFGSMIQAVVSEENRGELGMHYTSVPNIMKVIGPLFLDELQREFEASIGRKDKLRQLLHRIQNLHVFDPACGSGNFLIVTYKELRRIELKILREFEGLLLSGVRLDHFHGIEIDDFAHETAKLSMWLAEHQMNGEYNLEFGFDSNRLPLVHSCNVVLGSAARLDWLNVIPKSAEELFIIGNPPYKGSRYQSSSQKSELTEVAGHISKYRKLDYIAIWFLKALPLLQAKMWRAAYVSTNSIVQGEQVAILWPEIFKFCQISFAYCSFPWNNSARGVAQVEVVIIGLESRGGKSSRILYSAGQARRVSVIGPYLNEGSEMVVRSRTSSISNFPKMTKGCYPTDGGGLILDDQLVREEYGENLPEYVRPFVGTTQFLKGIKAYCLYLDKTRYNQLKSNPFVASRISIVEESRLRSRKLATKELAKFPYKFEYDSTVPSQGFVIPCITSSRRDYLPVGVVDNRTIVYGTMQVVYSYEIWLFSILSSTHMILWTSLTSGKMKSDFNYSSGLTFNTFPLPQIKPSRRQDLDSCALRILEVRERYPSKTLSDLYDPDKMPYDLREAHRLNDEAVDRCYKATPFRNDEERLTTLFKLYSELVEDEGTDGSLFGKEKKPRKKK